jgi:uncharacterized protein (TIGR01244 family)
MRKITERLMISGALTTAQIERLFARRCRAVVDLRADAEPATAGLPPWEERAVVSGLGMAYHQVPVGVGTFDRPTVMAVRRILHRTDGLVVLHCGTGRRAAALALIHLCCDGHRPLDESVARARAIGLDGREAAGLSAWWREYVLRHGEGEQNAPGGHAWSV